MGEEKNVVLAKVSGEYVATKGRDRVLRSYRATFRLPHAKAPLAMIKDKLLMPFLRKLDPDAVAPYSWNLEELELENGEFGVDDVPVMFQSKEQLKRYCNKYKLRVPVDDYSDMSMLRNHVMIAAEDPQAFQIIYAKYKQIIEDDNALAKLNNDFDGIGESIGEVAVDAETGTVRPKQSRAANAKKLRQPKKPVEEDDGKELSFAS